MISLEAHAKINLCLSVGGPTPPRGFHPIASLFSCIDLHDTITIEPLTASAESSHEITWAPDAPRPTPIDWPAECDLAVRAHRSLELASGRTLPLRMTLSKRIPVGGGLGGGSADAAAALLAIRDAFGLPLTNFELRTLGAALGSDVPFFIDDSTHSAHPPRPAIVTGFGETIERLASPLSGELLLAIPPFGCPTPAVYRAFDADPARATTPNTPASPTTPANEPRVRRCTHSLSSRTASLDTADLFNDLAQPAEAVAPLLGALRQQLSLAYACTFHITGSGSCMFAPMPAGAQTPPAQPHPGTTVLRTRLV
jgi:4-diphosphocytidyl-2-C-methyl-D-erythritol kinase